MLSVVIAICVMSIAYRLQKLGAQRVDAEKRASVAFAEMNRTTKELRTRMNNDPAEDPSLTPGERLRRMYPGVQRQTAVPDGESS
ncbi:MAG TPA: hypothetical protein VIM15_02785 [Gemmatimonadaceae bacterium]